MSRTLLTIETSTAEGSLAVWRDGSIIFSAEFASERTHNSVLFAPLAEALEVAPELDQIVVGSGPGSYTGVRVGIAAALGVAMARRTPICAANSLVSLTNSDGGYLVVGDARRGQWHLSELKPDGVVTPAQLGPEATVRGWLDQSTLPVLAVDKSVAAVLNLPLARPHAARLAQRVSTWTSAQWEQAAALPLEPIYLSPPFITQPKSKTA